MKKILFVFINLCVVSALFSQKKIDINIVYVGNSITQGVQLDDPINNAPPARATTYLQNHSSFGKVKSSNQGVSGNTTIDFLPETNTFFPKVKAAADLLNQEDACLLFSFMLGTNDSAIKGPNGSPVSPEGYFTNMKKIIDELVKLYPNCKIIIHHPIWYSPNTYNSSMYLEEGLNRLQSYFREIDRLVKDYPQRVFLGDTQGFDYFKENHTTELIPENGQAGVFYLHPNLSGAAYLGELWGKAICKVLLKP